MNALKTGRYIARKRKERNLTQEQLAERISVSNKTVSKWETGKCMPDYSVVEALCKELDVSTSELLSGEDCEKEMELTNAEQQTLLTFERVQQLEHDKHTLTGIIIIIMSIALMALSRTTGGSDFRDFISGFLLGLSISSMLVGIYLTVRSLARR